MAPGFAITDPAKLTLLTPGFDRESGAYADHENPGADRRAISAREPHRPEKNDLNSLLFLLTPGVESSKAGTLVSSLVAFKRLHDDNALLQDVIPEFVARRARALQGRAAARSLRRHASLLQGGERQRLCSARNSGRSISPRW